MPGEHEVSVVRLRKIIAEQSLRVRKGERLPVVSVTNHNGIQLASETFGRQVYSRELANYKVIKPGWYAYNPSRINVGSLARNELRYEVCVSPMYTVFEIISDGVDPDYLQAYLKSTRFSERVRANLQGSVRDALSFDALATFPILLPPIEEQRAIAAVLASMDAASRAAAEFLKATARLRDAMIFGGPTGANSRFSRARLGEIAKYLSAGAHVDLEKRPKDHGEIGVLKTSAASFEVFRPEENRAVVAAHRSRVKTPVKADCIIISRINTPELVGSSVYVENEFNDLFLPDRLWLLDVKDKNFVDVRWLALVLSSERYRKRLSDLATGTSGTMKYLSKSLVLGLDLFIPPILEQRRVAAIANALDEQMAKERAALEQLQRSRTSLTLELLSGRLRLPESMIARRVDAPDKAA